MREVLKIANLGLQRDEKNVPQFVKGLQDKNECIRYWSAQALVLMPKVSADTVAVMEQRLSSEPSVAARCALAEALIIAGKTDAARTAMLDLAATQSNMRFQLRAMNVLSVVPIDQLKAHRSVFQKIADESRDEYVPETVRYILFRIDGTYRPSSKVFGAVQLSSTPGSSGPRKPLGDPQV